jgi:hypothetical protein
MKIRAFVTAALATVLAGCGGTKGEVERAAGACVKEKYKFYNFDNLSVLVSEKTVSEAAKKNGTAWNGAIEARFAYKPSGSSASSWRDGHEAFFASVVNGQIRFSTFSGANPCAPL